MQNSVMDYSKGVENVAMDGRRIGRAEKVVENVAMDGVKIEERLCKSIIKCLARRNREKYAMLAEVEEENQDVVCFDDISGKELLWHAVRKARGQKLKYQRDLGGYKKVGKTRSHCKVPAHPN